MASRLYTIFAFSTKRAAELFMITGEVSLSKERKLVPIDWNDITIEEVKRDIANIFNRDYKFFILCELSFVDMVLIETKSKESAS